MKLNLTKDWYERNIEKKEETMNIDEAIEIATSTAITLTKLEMAEIAEMLAKEVERLREKLEMANEEIMLLTEDWYERRIEK